MNAVLQWILYRLVLPGMVMPVLRLTVEPIKKLLASTKKTDGASGKDGKPKGD